MTVKEYVDNVLCVPVTRIGNKYLLEAIELVLDTHEHKFYAKLEEILGVPYNKLETAMRQAKSLGLTYMSNTDKMAILGDNYPSVSEYVLKAAEYYRRTYDNKKE